MKGKKPPKASHDGLLSIGMDANGNTVFGRTPLGESFYDVLMSSLTAAEVVRRHPELDREFVLEMRRKHPEMRKRGQQWLKRNLKHAS